jgi:hypothetical protein
VVLDHNPAFKKLFPFLGLVDDLVEIFPVCTAGAGGDKIRITSSTEESDSLDRFDPLVTLSSPPCPLPLPLAFAFPTTPPEPLEEGFKRKDLSPETREGREGG